MTTDRIALQVWMSRHKQWDTLTHSCELSMDYWYREIEEHYQVYTKLKFRLYNTTTGQVIYE